jgi:hypothetical protein
MCFGHYLSCNISDNHVIFELDFDDIRALLRAVEICGPQVSKLLS